MGDYGKEIPISRKINKSHVNSTTINAMAQYFASREPAEVALIAEQPQQAKPQGDEPSFQIVNTITGG